MTKKVSKIFLYSVLSIVLLIGCAVLFTQTPMFRQTLRASLYTFLEKEVQGNIYIGEINGNMYNGFSVDTLLVYVDGSPFIEGGKLSVKYDLFDIFSNTVTIDTLTLEHPSVHLIRYLNGDWNVDHLLTPSSSIDSTESTLKINVGKLRIRNAEFRLIDSTGEFEKEIFDRNGKRSINYANIHLKNIDLEIGGSYSASNLEAVIHRLAFTSPNEKLSITHFSANILRTKQKSSVKNLLVATPASRIELSAEMLTDAFAITDLANLRRVQTTLSVLSSNIRTNDAQIFLPTLDFLQGDIFFDGEFEGNFENLSVKKLNTAFGKSTISLSGTVSNLYDPDELRLNIVSPNSTINPTDVPELMPFFNIPNYKDLGPLTLDLQFVGKPLDFLAISKIKSLAGTVTIDGQMMITEDNIHYKGIIAGRDVNLENVFASNDFLSRINTRIFIEGEGTSLATMNGEVSVEIDSSMFRNIEIQTAKMDVKASEKKVHTGISIQSDAGSIVSQSSIDFNNEQLPEYTLSAKVRGLDFAPIFRNDHFASRISLDLERWGTGLTLFNNPSLTKIDFRNSSFNRMEFDSGQVVLQWLQDSLKNDRLIVRSPVVDGSLDGKFSLNDIAKTVLTHVEGLERIYVYQRSIVDTSFKKFAEQQVEEHHLQESDFTYNLELKNLKPISYFFDFPELDIVGSAKGRMQSDSTSVSSSGEYRLSTVSYADTNAFISGKNIQLDFTVNNIAPSKMTKIGDPIKMEVKLLGNEIGIAETKLRMTALDFSFADQKGSYSISSDVDTTLSVSAEGELEVTDFMNKFIISTFYAKYQGFDIRSATPFIATATPNGLQIDSSVFIRKDEEFFVKGMYDYRGSVQIESQIKNFDLSDIFFVSTDHEFREQTLAFGGKVDASIAIGGTVQNPTIAAKIEGKDISYRNSKFGDLDAILNYAKKNAALKVELKNEQDSVKVRAFDLDGIVPIDLSFVSVNDRFNISGMDVQLNSGNLPVAILDVFIPEVDRMSGTLGGNIHLTGSLRNPTLNGSVQLNQGRFRLEMNDIFYDVVGTIDLDSQAIRFQNFTITNRVEDYSDGGLTVGGYIALNGFLPAEYHLTANGELLVLQDRSRTPLQSFFGTLVSQTGPNGLRFVGTFERSRIIGDLLIRNASLTFPPTQQAVNFSNARFDDVSFIDDTSRVSVNIIPASGFVTNANAAVMPNKSERTFLDGFGYELAIETRGNARVNMIFNANAGAYEELYAELNGKMILKKDETSQQLTGTINVGTGSTYEFYKKFNATGSLTFIGDPQNPQLNILAKYEGTHCKNFNTVTKDCETTERVIVSLEITGDRLNPKLKIGLATIDQNNDREIPRQGDVENDAIAFLLTSSPGTSGRFRDELTAEDRNVLGDQLASAIGGTYINNLLSGIVMDFIKQNNIPFVKRVEVRSVGVAPDVNVGLEFFNAVVNVGGRVFTDLNNANINMQLPILQNRNFILEVERKTEDYTIQTRTTLGARIFYRFTF